MTFEDRLAAAMMLLAAGCGDGDRARRPGAPTDGESGGDTASTDGRTCADALYAPTTTDPRPFDAELAAICEEDPDRGRLRRSAGYVILPPGCPCPEPEVARLVTLNCDFRIWQHVTCSFEGVVRNQRIVTGSYQGYFVDSDDSSLDDLEYGYEVSEPVDVCVYEGVFTRPLGTCGRPLRSADGEPTIAALGPGDPSWAAGPRPELGELDGVERAALAAYWLEAAALEHASVASFGKFAAELMSLGAPPALLEGAHRAAIDEIGHARACFGLAAAYLGSPVLPGALPAAGWPAAAVSAAEVATALVRDGCVGETLSALDAAARLAGATDPAVKTALQRIAAEESAHAALAWRALRWLLARDAAGGLAREVSVAFEAARAALRSAPVGPSWVPTPRARAHGLLSPATRNAVAQRAWREVIGPAASALGPASG